MLGKRLCLDAELFELFELFDGRKFQTGDPTFKGTRGLISLVWPDCQFLAHSSSG